MEPDRQQPNTSSSEDPSILLPTIPKLSLSRWVSLTLAAVGVVVLLAILHYSMRSPTPSTTETVRETPSGSIVTVTQPTSTPGVVPEIVKDKDGKEYITGEVIVVFRSTVPVEEAKQMVASAGGTIKQHFTQFPIFLVGISDPGSEGVSRAIIKFQTLSGVDRVEPNYLSGLPAAPAQ